MQVTKVAPAGWYPNPENPTQQRYWDGAAWTQHVAPVAASAPTTATAPTAPSECAQCGASIRSGSKSCEYCGAHVAASELVLVLDYHEEREKRILEAEQREADAARVAIESEKKREHTKDAWILGGLAAIMIVSFLSLSYGAGHEERPTTAMPAASSELRGDRYQDVQADLLAAGFTSVETTAVPDLKFLSLSQPGDVKEVSVDGQTDWDEGSSFPKDARIVIRYHDFPVKK